MFSIRKNKGLYLELCLLLDYIEEYDDLEWLGYLKDKWDTNKVLDKNDLQNVVGLIEDYLPSEIECDKSGCYLVNQVIDAYTPITNLEEPEVLDIPYEEIIKF